MGENEKMVEKQKAKIADRVSSGQARALGHQTPRSAAKRRRHRRQTRRRGVHRAPRDSDSNRANRARERVRGVPISNSSSYPGPVALWRNDAGVDSP